LAPSASTSGCCRATVITPQQGYAAPRKDEVPKFPGNVMREGTGAAVGTWQYALRRRGYGIGDAVFGPGTYDIVIDWQKKHRLEVTGVGDEATWHSLWFDK
jgi:peptidoglycan hydrolase-like protein with peptidoglycan-binding domain